MSDRLKRILIGLLALAALFVFVFLAFLFLATGITCEDAEEAAFDTVRCDTERGAGWRALQTALVLGAGLGLLYGIARAISRARFLPLVVGATVANATFFVVGLIDDIELGDKPVPRVTQVRLLDTACSVPCADGIRASVTVDRDAEVELRLGPARFEDIGDRQYNSEMDGHPDGSAEVDAGTHEFRVRGAIINPPSERGPLPAGPYDLEVTARPQNAGNQRDQRREPVKRRVTIRP